MAESFPLATVYCTDEDLACRALGDFGALVPDDQVKALGGDGVFGAEGWTLTSATIDFEARSVASGDMVRLWGAKGTAAAARYGPEWPGHWLAVASVSGASATLRRKGSDSGVGDPPGPAAGVSAVFFSVVTLRPQIERASRDLNARFGIDSTRVGRKPSDLYQTEDLREACELTVMHKLYLAASRSAARDDWKVKAEIYRHELVEVLGRIALRWGSAGEDRPASVRSGRVSR